MLFIHVEVDHASDPLVVTEEQLRAITKQPIMQIPNLVGPFQSNDEAALALAQLAV